MCLTFLQNTFNFICILLHQYHHMYYKIISVLVCIWFLYTNEFCLIYFWACFSTVIILCNCNGKSYSNSNTQNPTRDGSFIRFKDERNDTANCQQYQESNWHVAHDRTNRRMYASSHVIDHIHQLFLLLLF